MNRILIVLVLVGCRPPSEDTTFPVVENRSGTRLLAEVLEAPGGYTQFSRFHDAELDVPCTFERATDGSLRCLPVAEDGLLFYADAACEAKPVVYYYTEDPEAEFSQFARTYRRAGGQTCEDYLPHEQKIWLRGDEAVFDLVIDDLEVLMRVYEKDPSGECKPGVAWPPEFGDYYFSLTAPDLDMFVEGDVSYRSLGGTRLQEAYIKGEDGSVGPLPSYYDFAVLYDATLETRVEQAPLESPAWTKGGTVFWPREYGYVSWTYSDAACSKHDVTLDIGGTCKAQSTSVASEWQWFAAECTARPKYYDVGASLPQSYSQSSGGACVPQDATAIDVTYELGGEADLSRFAAGELTYESFGRLSLEVAHNSDGSRVPVGIWDEELGQRCIFAEGPLGTVRCEPEINGALTFFLQPDCTEPVISINACSPLQDLVQDPATDTWTRYVGGEELQREEIPALYGWIPEWSECYESASALDSPEDRFFLATPEPITLVEAQRVVR